MQEHNQGATATQSPVEDRPLYTFDGHGINGPDEYRSRVATLTEAGHSANLGPLIASLLNDAFMAKTAQ